MIKGCQKKVIWMRNTESDLFDEAYFILSERADKRACTESDMIKEAGRLIGLSPVSGYWGAKADTPLRSPKREKHMGGRLTSFLLGFAAGAIPLMTVLLCML